MTHVICRLTAKNRDQLRNPTLGNRVWATLTSTLCKHHVSFVCCCVAKLLAGSPNPLRCEILRTPRRLLKITQQGEAPDRRGFWRIVWLCCSIGKERCLLPVGRVYSLHFQMTAKLCALNLFFFGRVSELKIYHRNFFVMDNKHRKLFVGKQSKGCTFMPKMHQHTFGGLGRREGTEREGEGNLPPPK